MIRTEIVSANALEILAPEKLRADDFSRIAPLQQLRECLSF